MKITHTANPLLFRQAVSVTVVGAGGTGSALIPRLMQLHFAMLELGHPGGLNVTLWDDDVVSKSNIGRQCFFPADVGQHKSSLLINRHNVAWGTEWRAVTRRLEPSHKIESDIVIGCVDSRKGRAAILQAVRSQHCYYIDSGNAPTVVERHVECLGQRDQVPFGDWPVHQLTFAAVDELVMQFDFCRIHTGFKQGKKRCDRILAP